MAFEFLKKAKDTLAGVVKKASATLVLGVQKTAQAVRSGLDALTGRKLGDKECDDLLATLIGADLGPRLAEELVEQAREAYRERAVGSAAELAGFLKERLKAQFPPQDSRPRWAALGPTIVLIAGVNGSGKTTTIGKLAHRLKGEGRKVLLAAADTFRAAAVEQLNLWSKRAGVDIVLGKQGDDAASIAHNAVEKALAQGFDVVLVDTAGRLENKKGLMDELEKISRVIGRKMSGAPHEVLLVLDGTHGQIAVNQAKLFTEGVGVTGLVITKLDGTAKGGAVISMRSEVNVPVKWIGLGEQMGDLEAFDADGFLDAVFGLEVPAAKA